MLMSLLVALRDFLLVVALAWVGVTVEQRVDGGERCAGESCQAADR